MHRNGFFDLVRYTEFHYGQGCGVRYGHMGGNGRGKGYNGYGDGDGDGDGNIPNMGVGEDPICLFNPDPECFRSTVIYATIMEERS